ncbi:MAG: sn-glycerol-3-phosphate ABC transporter ATP-binding protein UgpC, partial [Planctomycetia bacterium]|nr:sn-glycerol-3-phosphate ABC transporter ATP-binding protein UgpC [Planctomycetia bacterium]
MASIKFKNIKKIYEPDNVVIKDFSIEIEDGEFVVLVGPSGCGKSTLLRIIAGLEIATEGNILIDDQIVNTIAPKDRNVAMVFQNYALYPHMSVFDNLAFGLRLRKFNKVEIRERVHKAAEILKITSLLGRKPKQLSGGERQRIALGRAIVRNPSVFLFDEPLSNLDAKLRVHMRAEIKKLHQQLKTTMVYVTHDQVEAMTIGDRIIILNDGIIQQIGTPLEVYKNPANIFVAGFIGSPPMNFINGEIKNNMFSFDNIKIELTSVTAQEINKRTKIIAAGIRPEDICFS